MLELIFSNRYELLEAALLDDLAQAPSNPLEPQSLVLPTLAVRRRVDLAYADRHGVCANLRCQFLAQWLWEQIGLFVDVPRTSPFAPDALQWRIFRLLGESPGDVLASQRLQAYLGKSDDGMRLELSQRIASLFDQYLTYRPEWLHAWSVGEAAEIGADGAQAREDAQWQAVLWQRITRELGMSPFHPAGDFFRQAPGIASDDPRLQALPGRVAIFCLPTLPRLYLHLLEWLARWMPIRLYLLNPCQEYWFEVVEPKRLAYLSLQGKDLLHETGNPLLASWGRQTQAQIDLLLGESEAETEVDGLFQRHAGDSLLGRLQNAILDLQGLHAGGLELPDASIEFHACHSLQRQLEVLHDRLLDTFDAQGGPGPADVLVVTPQLATAAPLIDAVFGAQPVGRRIPYAITGRPAIQDNAVARILVALFALSRGRFTASAVFDLLLQPAVARRFGFSTVDLDSVQDWMRGSGIRWGVDGHHRAACGLPESAQHTFADGLGRLFLGYAMPDGDDSLVAGMLPYAAVQGMEARVLGQFDRYVEALREAGAQLCQAQTASAWRERLEQLLATLLQPDADEAAALRDVRDTLTGLCERIAAGAGELPIAPEVMETALSEALDDPVRGGVPSGRVTFAAMPSLRALPYRVICFLGMDDGVFPSPVVTAEFDLMAQSPPRRGDRQRQRDERNLFLDLLLSARERVIFTYTGRSIRDNARLPPSVLVSELLDHLAQAFAAEGEGTPDFHQARAALVLEHPLQAFSPRYFQGDARLFSYDSAYCAAARARAAADDLTPMAVQESGEEEDAEAESPGPPFLAAPLPSPDLDTFSQVSLEQLFQFFRNPSRYLLRERLGIQLQDAPTALCDEEPFAPDWDSRRELSQRLLPLLLQGMPLAEANALAQAGREFPEGLPGELHRQRELSALNGFAERVRAALEPTRAEPVSFLHEFDLDGAAWSLSGALIHLHPGGQVRFRYDKARESDYLSAWIYHLALCALSQAGSAPVTQALTADGEFRLHPVAEPLPRLADLLALYRKGLSRPLPFFPRSAFAYVTDGGLRAARGKWLGNEFASGERLDPWHRLALRGRADPLDSEFAALAERILGPMLEHLEAAPS